MSTSLEKGDALENAVRSIETLIFRSSPALREQDVRIEQKKRIVVDGVRHEIDLYVEVDVAPGHKAVFIFECKNWSAPVNKNEMIIFAEKIDAVSAQKGYFVAKDYTSDAIAQSRKDKRLELLYAKEYSEITPLTQDLHAIFIDAANPRVDIKIGITRPEDQPIADAIDINNVTATYSGISEPLGAYVKRWFEKLVEKNLCTFQSQTLPADRYARAECDTRTFQSGTFYLADIAVERLVLNVEFGVHVLRPPIISHFDVATKGRFVKFAPVDVPGGELQYDITIANPSIS